PLPPRPTMIYTLSLHDALPISSLAYAQTLPSVRGSVVDPTGATVPGAIVRLESPNGDLVSETTVDSAGNFLLPNLRAGTFSLAVDRKSTRLNSSHVSISYAVFC